MASQSSPTSQASSTNLASQSSVTSISNSSTRSTSVTAPPTPSPLNGDINDPTTTTSDASLQTDSVDNGATTTNALNKAALIGIIAGGSAFLLIVFLLALFYILRRRKRRRMNQAHPGNSKTDEEQAEKRPTSRGPSQEPPQLRKSDSGPVYEAVIYDPQDSPRLPNPSYFHEKETSTVSNSPNMKTSLTLENENETVEEPKETTPLDPFSSGYIPPPSPTPSEYVIVDHTAEPSVETSAPRTSRDKRDSSLLDIAITEEGPSTINSATSGKFSYIGHRRTRSGEPSGSGTTSPKRHSNRLHKPRPSLESRSSSFLHPDRSLSPSLNKRSTSPIRFPRDPFDASVEEEGGASSPVRSSLDRANRSSASYDAHVVESPVSARPSMLSIAASIAGAEKGKQKGHKRTPSSPGRLTRASSPTIKRGPSSSALSLHHDPANQNGPYMNMHSPTMADASVYDFDIYQQPEPPTAPVPSLPPLATSARLSAAIDAGLYGPGSKKRYSMSMSDLPATPATLPFARGGNNRVSASASTNNIHLAGKDEPETPRGLEPTTNIYIPKESLDLPTS